jgi:hypothetical protein
MWGAVIRGKQGLHLNPANRVGTFWAEQPMF